MAFRFLAFIILLVKGKVKYPTVLVRYADGFILGALFLGTFALYLRTMPPTVLGGDSGEYQHMAYYLGVPHSTGYPLYILIAKLFTLLPFGDVAYRVNLLSVVCAALTVPFVYAVANRVTHSRAASIFSALILALAPTLWGAAVDAEVYALHLLLGVVSIWFALRWHQDQRARDFYFLALVYGLALTNHRIAVFVVPALVLVIWLNRAQLNRAMLGRGVLLVLIPLSLYAYIPLRADQLIAQQDPANWEFYQREDAIVKGQISAYYRHTPDGFFNLVTGFDNRNKLGFRSPLDEADRLDLAATLLLQQFGVAGILLIVVGIVASWRRDRQVFAILLTLAASVGFIAIYLRGESTVYYFSLAYFAFAVWLGCGIAALLRWASRVSTRPWTSPGVVIGVLCLLPLSSLVVNLPRLDKSGLYTFRDFAQAVLRDHLAPNAVVIAPWEVSEPMRYYQFVEGQRPDLLIVNVSPIWTQFDRMLTRARELGRPFYYVQFTPELKNSTGYRWVQAVPLPMSREPSPLYRMADARIAPEVQVLGFDVEPNPPMPGEPLRVLIYYRANARMFPIYSSMLTVTDLTGKAIGEFESFPATFYYPTYRWQPGDFYRDAYSFVLPADAPAGLYHLDLHWYVYDLELRKPDYTKESRLALGTFRAGDLSATRIENPTSQRVGGAITLLGWNSDTLAVVRGQSLTLDLFWRADQAIKESYAVFVHLVDANGQVIADADSLPSSGLFPADRWLIGEGVRDRHILKIPTDVPPGNYTLKVGMYLPATGARLPIGSSDNIVLTQVIVR